ncbi:hypothetical protein BY996DRAFT_3347828 [Phakopsora pachyrhizi]|nr:hypothetical protein BY996DRAFT_3347828 [Phakopsora pachyrhizi]
MDRLNLTSTREIPSKSINFVSDRSESQDSSTVSGNIAEKRNLDSSSLEPLSRGPKVSSLKPSADSDFSAKTPETLLSGSTPASGVMDPSLEGSISTLQGDHQLLSTRSHQSLSQAFQVGDGIIAELPTGVHALGSPSRSMYENHQTQLYDSGSSTASEESILQSLETSLEVFPRVSSPLEPTNLEVGFEQVSVETDPEPSLPRQLSDESAPVRRFASSRSSVESFSAITRAAVQPSRSRRVSGDSFLGEERFPSKKPSLDSLSSLSRKASKDELIEASLQETIESSRFGIVSAKELPVLEEVTEESDAPQLAHSNFEDQQWLSHGSSIPRTSFSHKSEQQNFEAETTAGGAQDLRPSIFSENASRTYSMSRSSESTLSYLEQELGSNNNDHLQQRVSVETNNVRFSKDSKLGFKEDELAAQVANTGQETCFIEDSRADEVMTSASRAMSIDKAFESSIVDSSKSEIHPAVNQLNKSDFQNSGEERKVDLNDYQTYIEHSTSRNPQNQILEVKGVQSISWADDEIKKIPELMSYQTSDPSETIYSSGVPPKPSLSEDTQAASSPISDIEKLNTARSDEELNEIVNLVELKNAISPTVTASQAHETSTTNSEIHSNIYHTESWRAKTSFQSNNEVIEGQSDPEFDANLTSALLVTDFRFTQDAEPGPSKASNFNLSHLSTGLPLGIKIEEKPLEFSSGSYSQCLSDVDENSNGGVVKNQNSLFELPSNADYSSLTRASEMAEDSTIVEIADLSRRGTLVIDPNDQKTVTIEVENVFEQENLLNREEEEESFSRADQDGFENENSMTVAQDKRQIIFEQAVDTSTEQSSHKVRPEETQELPSFYESFKDSAQIGDSNREESDHSPLMSTNAEEAVIPIQETAPSDDEASNRNIEENDIKAFYLPPTTSSLNSQVLLANDVTISQGLSVKDSITHEVALQEEEDFNVEEYESISKYHISDSNTETIHATELDTSPADAISRLHEHQVHHISDTKDLDSSLLGDILADSDRRRVFANVTGEGDRELIYEVQSAETTLKSFGSRDFSDAIRQVMPSNGKDDQARDNDITSSLRDWSIEAAHKSEVDSLREDIDGLAAPSALLKSETSNQADESLAKSESDAPTSTRDKADKGPIQFSSKNETAFTHKFIEEPHPISYEISNSENVYDLLTPTESAANASRIIHEEPPFVTLSEQNLEVTSGDGEEDEIIESKTASMETQVPAELQKLESEELANAVESQREVKDTNSRSVVTVAVKSLTGDVDDASTASDPEKHESAVAAEPNLLEFSGASLSDGAIADEKEAIEFLEERGTFAIPDSNVAAIKRAQQSETVAELTPVTRSLATEEEFTTAHNNEIYPTVSKIPESIEADNANSTQKVEGDIHASVNSFEATADLNVTINEKTKGEPPDILQSGVAKTSVAAYEVTTTPDFYEVNADTSYGLNKNRGAEKICSPDYPIELNNVLQSAEPVSSSTPTEDLTKKESEDMGGTLLPSADSTIGTTVVDSDKKVDSGGEINLDPQPRSDEVELVQESSNGSLIVENENETKSEADSYEALATDELPVVLADAISQTQASPLAEVKHEAVTDIEDTKYLIGPDDLTSLDSKDLNQLADPISTSLPVKDSTGHEDEDTSEDQLLADQADAGVDKEDKSVTETLILAPDEARGEASILGEVVKTVDQPLASEDEVEPKQVGNLDAEINRSTDVEVENVEILTGVQEDAELHPLSPKEEDVTNMEGLKRGLTITEEVSAALAIESIITDRALREPSAGNDGLFADVVVEENAGDVEVQPPLLTEEVIVTNVEGVKEGLSLTEEVPAAYVIESSTADRSLPEPSAESYGLVADVVAEEKTSTAEVQPPSSTEGGILRHLEDVKEGLSSTDVVLAPTKIESSIEDQDLPEPSAEIDGVVANVVVEEKASAVELQPPLSTEEDIVTYVEGVKKELPITKEVFAAPEIESIITDQALPVHYAESESVAAFDTVDDSTILVDGINLEPQSSTDETKASCQEPGDVPFVVVSSDETKNETDSHVDLATENLNLDLADSILQTQPTLEAESEREVVVDIEEAKVSEQTALEGVDSATKADSALVASEGAKNLTFQEDDDLLQPEEAITASAADTAEKECEDLRETCLIVEQADAGNDEKAKITAKASPESLDVVIRQETFSKEVVQSFNHASASENEDELNPAENAKQEDEDNNPVNFEEENGRSLSDGKEETYIQPPASTGADTAAKLEGGEEGLLITEEVSAKISADVKDDSQGHTAPLTEEGIVTHEEGERGSLLVAEEVHTKPVIESTTADQNLSESSTECKSEVAVDTVNEKAISGRAIHLDPQSSKDETDLSVQKPGDVALALDSADETREEANCHKDSAAGELLLVAADVISQIPAVHIAKVEREAMKEREEIEVDEQATLKEEESSAEAEFLKIASEAADNLPGPSHFDPSDSANAHQRIEPTSTPREISNEQDSIDTNESHLKADQTNAVDDKLVGFVAKTLRYGQDVIEGEVPISEEVEKTSDQLPSVDDEAELNLVDNAGAEVDSPVDVEDDIAEIMPDGIEASQVQLPSLTDEGVSTHVEEEKESVFAATLEQSSTTPVMDLPELSAESESVVEVNTANVIAIFVDSKNQDTQPSLDETESAGQDSGDLSFAVDSVDETKNEADSHEALAAGGISTVSTGAISQPQAATLAEIETEALKDNKEGKAAAKNDEESDTKDLSVSFTIAGAENQPGPEELQLMNPANVHLLEEPFSDHTEDITKQDINESQLATDQAGTDNVMQTAIVDENLPSELSATEGKAPIAEVLKTIDRSPASEDEVELKLVENAEAEVDSPTDVGKASTQAPPAAPSSENENEELINSEDTIVAEKIDSQVEEPATKGYTNLRKIHPSVKMKKQDKLTLQLI